MTDLFFAMPTYDYHCSKCGENFEAVQSMKDPHFQVCPENLCRMKDWGQGAVKRQLGAGAGLIFKGSGFYITDYRSSNYQEGAKKEAGVSSSGGGGEKSGGSEAAKPKTDAAPAPKAETPKPSAPPPAKPAS
jgi:putative FmdB family regulatory protein